MMMVDPIYETQKRLMLANQLVNKMPSLRGALIAGSVAYGFNYSVREDSDLDMVVITDNLKELTDTLILDKKEATNLKKRFFDGYCIKYEQDGVDISIHALSKDAFDVICISYVADIRVYRNKPKKGAYKLLGFNGDSYEWTIKNIAYPDLNGFRTIVPVSFQNSAQLQKDGTSHDRYHLGIHRDKLLSKPLILLDDNKIIKEGIDKLWCVVVENLFDESLRVNGSIDLKINSILQALAKKERFTFETTEHITNLTLQHLLRFTI